MANIAERVGAYLFCEKDYPRRIAFAFLNKVLEQFFSKVGDNWKKYNKDELIEVPEIAAVSVIFINRHSTSIRIQRMLIRCCWLNRK